MSRFNKQALFWLFVAILLIAAAIFLGPAHGHEAASGWQYPARPVP